MLLNRIYINEMATALNLKPRSCRAFCHRFGVALLVDENCKKQYAIRAHFEAAMEIATLSSLAKTYGKEKVEEILNAGMKLHAQLMSALEAKQNKERKYEPKGRTEASFLSLLKNLKH